MIVLGMNTTTSLSTTLRLQGHRMTAAREALLRILEASNQPLSVEELRGRLSQMRLSVNKTTVYRELVFLKSQAMVREIELGDERKRYELASDKAHHHHMVCSKCKSIEDVVVDESLERRLMPSPRSFRVKSHLLEFFGLCAQCQ